jgi:hypothetical protein
VVSEEVLIVDRKPCGLLLLIGLLNGPPTLEQERALCYDEIMGRDEHVWRFVLGQILFEADEFGVGA